jgi:N4-gp56 family major capsid protein
MFDYMKKINLQLFAELNTNVTTDSGLSVEMKTFYDMTLIDEASAQLVHDQFGQKRPIPKNGGKTIEFRKFGNLPKATTPIQEGVTPNGKKLSVTSFTATVAQYGDYIVQSDILELTSLDNTILEATKILGKQAGLTLDTVVRNVLIAGTNVNYCPKVADGKETAVTSRATLDATAKLTVKEIQKAVTKLRANNAPTINGDYVAIVHPHVVYDLMRDPEWIESHKYAQPENLYTGEVGKVAGVRFVQSSEAAILKGDGCPTGLAVYCTLLLAEGAYGVTEITGGGLQTIVKQKGSAGTADPLDQRSSIGWKAIKTAERLVENYMIRIESCGEFSATAQAN